MNEYDRLEEQKRQIIEKDQAPVRSCLALLRSVILSGEEWSVTLDEAYSSAVDSLDRTLDTEKRRRP